MHSVEAKERGLVRDIAKVVNKLSQPLAEGANRQTVSLTIFSFLYPLDQMW